MSVKRIYLTGFMASGKSTLGVPIANTLGWDFYDLDEYIVNMSAQSIVDIFRERGEIYFRETESKALKELALIPNSIIALGGGTLFHNDNFNLIQNSGKLIYLKTSPENIYQRVKNKTNRPLLLGDDFQPLPKEETIEKIKSLLKERENFYNKSDIVFNIDNKYIGRTVDNLVNLIRRKFKVS